MKIHYVYMMANRKDGIIYTGMTNDIVLRAWQHKNKVNKGFTSRYNVDKLMWYEEHQYVWDAIAREKEIKGWRRSKKVRLIEERNPNWNDLSLK